MKPEKSHKHRILYINLKQITINNEHIDRNVKKLM